MNKYMEILKKHTDKKEKTISVKSLEVEIAITMLMKKENKEYLEKYKKWLNKRW